MQEVIVKRHSIRKYTSEPVSTEETMALLEAAMSAPSAGNERPWHFVVITDRAVREEIPRFQPHAAMVPEAPQVIAVCADLEREKFPGNWPLDCSAATENLLLSAEAQGLGAVWLGIYPEKPRMKALAELLKLPENVRAFSLVALGHPAETKEPSNRFDATRIHWERW